MSTTRCEYCGKPLVPLTSVLLGRKVTYGYKPCVCAEAVKQRKLHEQREQRAKEISKQRDRDMNYADAGIPKRYILESYIVPDSIMRNAQRGLYIYGPVGTGKTYTAAAVAKTLIDGGASVQFTNIVKLLEEVRDTYSRTKSTQAVIAKYVKCDHLFIDDIGKENATTDALAIIYRIVDERWSACKPTSYTSNYPRAELVKKLSEKQNDKITALSIVSRLQECWPLELTGTDQRLRR